MKIVAYECCYCGKIFKSESAMKDCNKRCKQEENHAKKLEQEKKEFEEFRNSFRFKLEDIYNIPSIILEVADTLNIPMEITEFNVRFSHSLAATHDAPIGKPTEWGVKDNRNYYLGWNGRISGTTSLYSKPIKNKLGPFREISSIRDLCKVYIPGINIGGGGGGDRFSYSIRLYLDDFPKLKSKHEEYLKLLEQQKIYKDKEAELICNAESELINKDEAYDNLTSAHHVLTAKAALTLKLINKRVSDIKNSKKWSEVVEVPSELCYDKVLAEALAKMFI